MLGFLLQLNSLLSLWLQANCITSGWLVPHLHIQSKNQKWGYYLSNVGWSIISLNIPGTASEILDSKTPESYEHFPIAVDYSPIREYTGGPHTDQNSCSNQTGDDIPALQKPSFLLWQWNTSLAFYFQQVLGVMLSKRHFWFTALRGCSTNTRKKTLSLFMP